MRDERRVGQRHDHAARIATCGIEDGEQLWLEILHAGLGLQCAAHRLGGGLVLSHERTGDIPSTRLELRPAEVKSIEVVYEMSRFVILGGVESRR